VGLVKRETEVGLKEKILLSRVLGNLSRSTLFQALRMESVLAGC